MSNEAEQEGESYSYPQLYFSPMTLGYLSSFQCIKHIFDSIINDTSWHRICVMSNV